MNKNIGIFGKNQVANLSLFKLLEKQEFHPVMSVNLDVFLKQLIYLNFEIVFCNFMNSNDDDYQILEKIFMIKPDIKIICVINKNCVTKAYSFFNLGVVEIIEAPFNYQNLIDKFNRIVFNCLT
jgi:DNA-binding NtrC family response regulator